ncbi:PHB2, partial [Symbiodinium sp. KB8]
PHSPNLQADQQEPSAACEDTPSFSPLHQQTENREENEIAEDGPIADVSEHTVEDIHASQEDDEEEFPTEDDDLEWDSDESDEDSDPDLQEERASFASLLSAHKYTRSHHSSDEMTNLINHKNWGANNHQLLPWILLTPRHLLDLYYNMKMLPAKRPYYMQSAATQQEGVEQGDTLFAQPAHLTSATAPSSSASAILDNSDRPSGTPLDPLDISDLDLEADQAVSQGLAPGWSISGQQATARASIREGEISFDIAWTPGPEPPSIPPTVPLAPHTVLTLRGSAIGSWRGHLWTPSRGDIIRHPPRTVASPTIVAYRPLNTPPKGPALPSGACLTMRPVGTWISSTRFDLTSARTPRFWLVHIESSPPAGQGELPLTAGQSFFLEWMGDEREWVRRPRFADDIQQLGGFSTISELPPPEPPLPPQRHGFDNADPAPRRPKNTQTGVAPDRAGPYQQPPQRLTPQTTAAKVASTTTTNPTRPAKASVKAGPKAKPPPLPPQPSSGSESETSWPSEDPVAPEEDEEALSMMSTKKSGGADKNKSEPDNDDHEITSHMQRPTISPSPPSEEKETKNGETNPEEPSQTEWMTVVHNFPFPPQQPVLTHMAYHAAFYISKLIELYDEEHMTVSFHVANPLTEIEATLGNLNANYEHLPRRHVQNELGRIQAMLEESRTKGGSRPWEKQFPWPTRPPADVLVTWRNWYNGSERSAQRTRGAHPPRRDKSKPVVVTSDQTLGHAVPGTDPVRLEMTSWTEMGSYDPPSKDTDLNLELLTYLFLPPIAPYMTDMDQAAVFYLYPRESLQYLDLPGKFYQNRPMNVLKAQHIMERLMPFMEQEAAIMLQEAHALLMQWTTDLWGTPIALVVADQQQAGREDAGDEESCTATVPFSPLDATVPDEEALTEHAAGAG